MSNVETILNELPKVRKAAAKHSTSQAEKQRRLAPWVLKKSLSEQESFGLQDLVSASGLPDTVTNHIGTVLGKGQGGKGGMGLWRDRNGYIPCRENALLALDHLDDAMLEDFLEQEGLSQSELLTRLEALPLIDR